MVTHTLSEFWTGWTEATEVIQSKIKHIYDTLEHNHHQTDIQVARDALLDVFNELKEVKSLVPSVDLKVV